MDEEIAIFQVASSTATRSIIVCLMSAGETKRDLSLPPHNLLIEGVQAD